MIPFDPNFDYSLDDTKSRSQPKKLMGGMSEQEGITSL